MSKAEKIKAEIERLKNELIQEAEKGYKSEFDEGRISAFEDMIVYIDTLEVKDANEALRTEYEKGRADVIAKTLEWINVFNDNNYIMQYSGSCEHPINEIIEWYKNYINRE